MEFKGTKDWFIQQDWNGDFYGIKENENGVPYLSIGDEFGCDSIHVFSDFTKKHEDKITEMKANALLISKAPEMLEYLQDAVNEYKAGYPVGKAWIDAVERLIKEATEL